MSAKYPWVRVRDESELRAGMVRIVKPIDFPDKPELRLFLFSRVPDPSDVSHAGYHTGPCPTWRTSGEGQQRIFCPIMSIREGRLYRLAPDATTDDAETTTAPKRRERVG